MRSIPLALAGLLASLLASADAAIPVAEPDPRTGWHYAIGANSPSSGPRDAKLTIVEFADFQCPYSARVADTLKELQKKYGRDLRLVFRNYPLPFHPKARGAAEAAVAAQAQGKFWPMHDLLFHNFQHLDPTDLQSYATQIGLDVGQARAAIASGKVAERLDHDLADVKTLEVSATPSFFINGRRFTGAQPVDAFVKVLDEELARANAELARGTPRQRLYDVLAASASAKKAP